MNNRAYVYDWRYAIFWVLCLVLGVWGAKTSLRQGLTWVTGGVEET